MRKNNRFIVNRLFFLGEVTENNICHSVLDILY